MERIGAVSICQNLWIDGYRVQQWGHGGDTNLGHASVASLGRPRQEAADARLPRCRGPRSPVRDCRDGLGKELHLHRARRTDDAAPNVPEVLVQGATRFGASTTASICSSITPTVGSRRLRLRTWWRTQRMTTLLRIRGMEGRSRFAASDDGSCPPRGSSDHGVVATRCMLTGLAGARATV
jgi:hypothetical protein